jgi:hypothetical protein
MFWYLMIVIVWEYTHSFIHFDHYNKNVNNGKSSLRRFIAIIYSCHNDEIVGLSFYVLTLYKGIGHYVIQNNNLNNFLYIQRM